MSDTTYDYDLIVIGGGPVGENVADYATKRGVRVAIVEAELVGGECSYWACMPSKALLRSGHAVRAAQRVAGAREAVTGRLDASAVLARRTSFTDGWDDAGQVAWLESAGIDLDYVPAMVAELMEDGPESTLSWPTIARVVGARFTDGYEYR